MVHLTSHRNRNGTDSGSNCLGYSIGIALITAAQQNRKFIATDARSNIGLPDRTPQDATDID